MKLTYVILAHNDPRHLARLVSSLSNKNVSFVIHIDSRSQMLHFTGLFNPIDLRSITFIKNRCSTSRGGFEVIRATLNCLEFIYREMLSIDRVIFLSGHDYPIMNNKYISSYFKRNSSAIYIEFRAVTGSKLLEGEGTNYPFYEEISAVMKIYEGSQSFSFPTSTLKIVFDFLEMNPGFLAYYHTVTIPEKSFFQTLFVNCGEEIIEQTLVNKSLHLKIETTPGGSPSDFIDQHFKIEEKNEYLFAAKFNTLSSSKVLDKIDMELFSQNTTGRQKVITTSYINTFNKSVILFLTHKGDKNTVLVYLALKTIVSKSQEVSLLYHQKRKKLPKLISMQNPILFDNEILSSLGFESTHDTLVPGSNHFPLFQYFEENPYFDYYWYIEDDVRYNGEWNSFFDSFTHGGIESDFLSCHIRSYDDEPNWFWWESLKHTSGIRVPLQFRLRSFNPIFRISNRALKYLTEAYRSGWSGHHEVTIATLLNLAGYSINDLGGKGPSPLDGITNKYYEAATPDVFGSLNSGSVRFRPIIDHREMNKVLLYHPVKVPTSIKSLKKL